MENKIRMKGKLTLELYDKDMNLKERFVQDNLVLTDGLEIAADLLGGTAGQTKLQVIAVGDNNTPPIIGNTDLAGSELGRVVTSNSQISPGKERFQCTFGAGIGTGIWREAVIADTNAASGSRKCACRTVFGDINKLAGDVMTATWDITYLS